MLSEETPKPGVRQHYGIAEIADALGIDRQLATMWRRRRSHGMPEPDDELAAGPLWLASTIDPWIARTRARLEMEQSDRSGRSTGQRSALSARALRRYLRLMLLLLDESLRPTLAGKAAQQLGELVPALEQLVADDRAAARRLEGLLELARRAGRSEEAVIAGDETTVTDLLRECITLLPRLTGLAEYCLAQRLPSQSE